LCQTVIPTVQVQISIPEKRSSTPPMKKMTTKFILYYLRHSFLEKYLKK